jgi:hypothetical protein
MLVNRTTNNSALVTSFSGTARLVALSEGSSSDQAAWFFIRLTTGYDPELLRGYQVQLVVGFTLSWRRE